jgi:Ca2+-binding EF-hand superfamily protein
MLLESEASLKRVQREIDTTERRAQSLGKNTATAARGFERLTERVSDQRTKLTQLSEAYRRGDITSKQFEKALQGVDRAAGNVNSRIRDSQARLTDFANKTTSLQDKLSSLGSGLTSVGQSMTVGLTAPLTALGYAALRSATSFDDLRNKLQAAAGGAEAGAKKFKELFELAQASPGVLTSFAVELYAMLKPMKLSESAIQGLIKSFGRIRLQQPSLDIQQFSRNLQQMFTTFDRQDFKEAFEQFPRFGEIVAEKFALSGSDIASVQKGLKELKESGALTYEQFIQGFNEAIAGDPALGGLQETISTRMSKAMERITLALEPLGQSIAAVLERALPPVIAFIEQLSGLFNRLSPSAQTAIVAVGAFAAALGPLLIVAGSVASAVSSIIAFVGAVGGMATLGPIIAVVVAALAGIAIQVGLLYAAWETNFGGIRELTAEVANAVKFLWDDAAVHLTELTAELTAEIAKFWAENGEQIKEAVTTVSEFIKAIWGAVADFWRENGETIKTITKAIWDQVSVIVKTGLQLILATIKAVTAIINGDWKGFWDSQVDITKIAWAALNASVEASIALLKGIITLGFEAIFALNGWIYDQAVALGKRAGEGVRDGLRAMIREVKDAGLALAKAGSDALTGAWIIRSPSQLFYGYGEMAGQGLIDGLTAMQERVRSAMVALSDPLGSSKKFGDIFGENEGGGTGLFEALRQEMDVFEVEWDAFTEKMGQPPPIDTWANFWGGMQYHLQRFKDSLPSMKEALGVNLINSIESVGNVFANAVSQWDGTAKGFFQSLAQGFRSMVQQIISELIRLAVMKAILNIAGSLGGSIGGAASGGGGGSYGDIGGGYGAGFASGGMVQGRGTGTSDSILARLSKGEFVMNAEAVKKWGSGFMHQLNSGFTPAFAGGGMVGGSSYSNTWSPSIVVNVSGGGDPNKVRQSAKQGVNEAMRMMEREKMRHK